MGGEKSAALKSDTTATGSPPHGRGKADTRAFESAFPRITPAWAGKRLHLDVKDKPAQDHPRMGGEKLAFPAILARELGSPPHGRGKEHAAPAGHTAAGITPAWAGKRDIVGPFFHYPEDHPRMGGEKPFTAYLRAWWGGSPPHGRGKGHGLFGLALDVGITPAWAGKSFFRVDVHEIPGDHPRMGGEKPARRRAFKRPTGSPPHGRGKDRQLLPVHPGPGITPAWAGKSVLLLPFCRSRWDHPRMGGEKLDNFYMLQQLVGSPPHGRGKGQTSCALAMPSGITPAWAGKSSGLAQRPGLDRDHPRMGGDL